MSSLLERLRSLFRIGLISLSAKFMARITWAAVLGVALSPFDTVLKLGFGGALAIIALGLSMAFFGWDRQPIGASRMALYGLYVAGEVLALGAMVFAFLGAFQGQPYVWETLLCAFGGALFCVYPLYPLTKRNIPESQGSM